MKTNTFFQRIGRALLILIILGSVIPSQSTLAKSLATTTYVWNLNNDFRTSPNTGTEQANPPCNARIEGYPTEYYTVQSAVDAAKSGDIVKVAGYCTENVMIDGDNSGITLSGGYSAANWTEPDITGNPTVIDGNGQSYAITVHYAYNVTIKGFYLMNASRIISVYPAADVHIERNFIHSTVDYLGYASGISVESVSDFETHNVTITNNVIWDIKNAVSNGIRVGYHQPNYMVRYIFVMNNTVYDVAQDGMMFGSGNLPINIYNLTVKNNIIVRAGDTGLQIHADMSTLVADYNLVYDSPELYYGYSGGSHDINADPLFSDPGAADFHLQLQSPAIDAGNNAEVAATDMAGNPRIVNGLVDMGAYEIQNTTSATLTVQKTGAGEGAVTSAPAGVNCGADCSEVYALNTPVTLTATADSGSTFTGWAGCDSVNGNQCVLTMTANKTVTANFAKGYTLNVQINGAGNGKVVSAPAGIDCGAICSANYPANTVVKLTATPKSGFFMRWFGSCAAYSFNPVCSVTMDAAKSVRVLFLKNLVLNGGFNTYPVGSKIPSDWKASNFGPADGKDAAIKYEGTASVKFVAASHTTKTLTQTQAIDDGFGGDVSLLSYWISGGAFPEASCKVQLKLYNGKSLVDALTLSCSNAVSGWQQKSGALTASSAYTKMVIQITVSDAIGAKWIDAVKAGRASQSTGGEDPGDGVIPAE